MPDKQSPGTAGATGGARLDSPTNLIGFAQDYFAGDFPNPGRLGCPPRGAVRAAVLGERPPHARLRAHLFGCSECFREYRAALLSRQESTAPRPEQSWRRRLLQTLVNRKAPVLAGALSLAVVCLVGAYARRARRGGGASSNKLPEPTAGQRGHHPQS
jgi:hypothetical protein